MKSQPEREPSNQESKINNSEFTPEQVFWRGFKALEEGINHFGLVSGDEEYQEKGLPAWQKLRTAEDGVLPRWRDATFTREGHILRVVGGEYRSEFGYEEGLRLLQEGAASINTTLEELVKEKEARDQLIRESIKLGAREAARKITDPQRADYVRLRFIVAYTDRQPVWRTAREVLKADELYSQGKIDEALQILEGFTTSKGIHLKDDSSEV